MGSNHRSRSRELPVQHEDHEWEAQKANFYQCYIIEEMTLAQATVCMKERHKFPASKRQWERKAKHWKFTKYVPEEARWRQLEEGGPTDRNQRRFARRHSQTRSNSPLPPGTPSRTRQASRSRANSTVSGPASAPSLSPTTESHRPPAFLHSQSDPLVGFGESSSSQQFEPFPGFPAAAQDDLPMSSDEVGHSDFLKDLASPDPPHGFQLTTHRANEESQSHIPLQESTDSSQPIQLQTRDEPMSWVPSYDFAGSQFTPSWCDDFVVPSDIPNGANQADQALEMQYSQPDQPIWLGEIKYDDQNIGQQQSFPNANFPDSTDPQDVNASLPQIPMIFVGPFVDAPVSSDQNQFRVPTEVDPSVIENMQPPPGRMTGSEQSNGTSHPDLGLSNFLMRIDEYNGRVQDIITATIGLHPEFGSLREDLGKQCVSFRNEMRIEIESLVNSLNRLHQYDREMVSRLRRRNHFFGKIMADHNIDIEQYNIRVRHPGAIGPLPPNFYSSLS